MHWDEWVDSAPGSFFSVALLVFIMLAIVAGVIDRHADTTNQTPEVTCVAE